MRNKYEEFILTLITLMQASLPLIKAISLVASKSEEE